MLDEYKTIANEIIGEGFYSEKRSKFLAFAHHIESVDEAKKSLTGIARNITMPVMCVMPICLVQSALNFVLTTMANLRQQQANLSLVR